MSNTVKMNVTPMVTPTVVINSSTTSICQNAPVTFNAAINGGGSIPLYQWKKNGNNVGVNSGTYKDSNILNGDVISCMITSNSNCLAVSSAISNAISMMVFQNPNINLDHSTTICNGSTRQLDAGNFSSYLWNNGSTARSLIISSVGTYYVRVIDNSGCISTDTTRISTLLPIPNNFLTGDTAICLYGSLALQSSIIYNTYLWNTNLTSSIATISKSGLYWLDVTDNNNCSGRDSIVVSQKDCMSGFYMSSAFTPNVDGKNDFLKPLLFGNLQRYEFWIYNRFGQIVFHTTDITNGWDGNILGIKQDTNTFVWVCSYALEGDNLENKKGTALLIR